MIVTDIYEGRTYRSPRGRDHYVIARRSGQVHYRVENSDMKGRSGFCHVDEFAERMERQVQNYPVAVYPFPAVEES